MYETKMKIATTVALSLAAALTLGACNKKADDIVKGSAPTSTSSPSGTSSGSGAMAPSGGNTVRLGLFSGFTRTGVDIEFPRRRTPENLTESSTWYSKRTVLRSDPHARVDLVAFARFLGTGRL